MFLVLNFYAAWEAEPLGIIRKSCRRYTYLITPENAKSVTDIFTATPRPPLTASSTASSPTRPQNITLRLATRSSTKSSPVGTCCERMDRSANAAGAAHGKRRTGLRGGASVARELRNGLFEAHCYERNPVGSGWYFTSTSTSVTFSGLTKSSGRPTNAISKRFAPCCGRTRCKSKTSHMLWYGATL